MSIRQITKRVSVATIFWLLGSFLATASVDDLLASLDSKKPAEIVAELKKLNDEDYYKLAPSTLVKASYAAAQAVDVPLTVKLTDILLTKSIESGDSHLAGQAYYNRGAAYAYSGRHDLALDALLLALSNFESGNNQKDIARIKGGLALMYVELNEYALAQPYFEEAIHYHRSHGDQTNLAMVLQNRGFMEIQLSQYDLAKRDLVEALDISERNGLESNFPVLYKNLGKIEFGLGNSESAARYFEQAMQRSISLNLDYQQSEILREIAALKLRLGDKEAARQNINASIAIGERYKLYKQLYLGYLLQADILVAFGDYKAAYLAKAEAEQQMDKMGNSRIATNLSRLDRYTTTIKEQNKRKLLEQETQIATLAAERELLFRNFSVSVAVIAILLAIYFIRRFSHSNRQAQMFEQQSKIDPLTGIWNRRAGEAKLARLCNRDKEGVAVFSIAMLDIDHFKKVNDLFGHDIGDKVIVTLCNLVQQSLRPTDMLCRWGGEEFVLILEQFNADKAYDICERIRKTIATTQVEPIGGLTVSIGIAMFESDDLFELIKRGDQALYHAKHLGRNRVVIKRKLDDLEEEAPLISVKSENLSSQL